MALKTFKDEPSLMSPLGTHEGGQGTLGVASFLSHHRTPFLLCDRVQLNPSAPSRHPELGGHRRPKPQCSCIPHVLVRETAGKGANSQKLLNGFLQNPGGAIQ